ncbi:hypothetical protein KSP40_PGU012602 [Platanthera guangdongensis]|uniref:Secreted protein n=1 Tax=Platanthera guangdongensis TaxID=2320717 RepID=A0ABR2MDR9_9ASPA
MRLSVLTTTGCLLTRAVYFLFIARFVYSNRCGFSSGSRNLSTRAVCSHSLSWSPPLLLAPVFCGALFSSEPLRFSRCLARLSFSLLLYNLNFIVVLRTGRKWIETWRLVLA